jgi:hypothetical protein
MSQHQRKSIINIYKIDIIAKKQIKKSPVIGLDGENSSIFI